MSLREHRTSAVSQTRINPSQVLHLSESQGTRLESTGRWLRDVHGAQQECTQITRGLPLLNRNFTLLKLFYLRKGQIARKTATDRQTDRARDTDRERDRPTETDRQTERKDQENVCVRAGVCMTERETERQTDKQTDRQTDRDRDRDTDRQTDRQTDRSDWRKRKRVEARTFKRQDALFKADRGRAGLLALAKPVISSQIKTTT